MKVLVIGAGHLGCAVIKQLQKVPEIDLVVSDWKKDNEAIKAELIDHIDVPAHITPMNMQEVLEKVGPDIIIIARTPKDWRHEDTTMGVQFIDQMEKQLMGYGIPVILASPSMKFF